MEKSTSKWDGLYVVQDIYLNSAYKIIGTNGAKIGPINAKFLTKYYPWQKMTPIKA